MGTQNTHKICVICHGKWWEWRECDTTKHSPKLLGLMFWPQHVVVQRGYPVVSLKALTRPYNFKKWRYLNCGRWWLNMISLISYCLVMWTNIIYNNSNRRYFSTYRYLKTNRLWSPSRWGSTWGQHVWVSSIGRHGKLMEKNLIF